MSTQNNWLFGRQSLFGRVLMNLHPRVHGRVSALIAPIGGRAGIVRREEEQRDGRRTRAGRTQDGLTSRRCNCARSSTASRSSSGASAVNCPPRTAERLRRSPLCAPCLPSRSISLARHSDWRCQARGLHRDSGDFRDHPKVADGASELLVKAFGTEMLSGAL